MIALSLFVALGCVSAAPKPEPKAPKPQPAFTTAEAGNFFDRWMCDPLGGSADGNPLLADRPKGPKVELYPVDRKRGALVGKNSADGVIEPNATAPVTDLVWVRTVLEMSPPFGAYVAPVYPDDPKTCTRGACLFDLGNLGQVWFALRRDKKKELIVGIFPVQAKTAPTSDPRFTPWLDAIDAAYGPVATP